MDTSILLLINIILSYIRYIWKYAECYWYISINNCRYDVRIHALTNQNRDCDPRLPKTFHRILLNLHYHSNNNELEFLFSVRNDILICRFGKNSTRVAEHGEICRHHRIRGQSMVPKCRHSHIHSNGCRNSNATTHCDDQRHDSSNTRHSQVFQNHVLHLRWNQEFLTRSRVQHRRTHGLHSTNHIYLLNIITCYAVVEFVGISRT